jgi:hypothetical protein
MKKIIFIPSQKEPRLEPPTPSKKLLPKWYIDMEPWIGGKPKIRELASNNTGKQCVPFLDSLTFGYMLRLHTDVEVIREPGVKTATITWKVPPNPVIHRDPGGIKGFPVPSGHDSDNWAFLGRFGFKVPNGYSVLVTHPLNRFDLPFTITSGIMDADSYFAEGSIPFFLKSNFEGVIERGTPIAQIIPFKKESWSSEVSYDDKYMNASEQVKFDANSVLSGYYKKMFWNKKTFD